MHQVMYMIGLDRRQAVIVYEDGTCIFGADDATDYLACHGVSVEYGDCM